VIYLDNAATSFPKPESVYQAMDAFARTTLANPGRSGHKMALACERILEEGRHQLNQFLHGYGPERVIFTLNGTDSLNIAIKGVLRPGDHVITTDQEHNSVSRPLVSLQLQGLITLTQIAADPGGTIDPAAVQAALTPQTRLVAVTHAGNVLGTIQPIADLGALCRATPSTLFLVDAAQTVGVVPIDMQAMQIDLLAFPGHKGLYGPTGTGALLVGPRAHVTPWREGGTGGDSTTPTQPQTMPYYLEGGTPNVLGIVGLLAGLKFVRERNPDQLRQEEVALTRRLYEAIAPYGYEFFGHQDWDRRVGTISFRHPGIAAPDLGAILDDSFDIAIRPGLHCAPYAHQAQQTLPEGLVRVSVGAFNTAEQMDQLAQALQEIMQDDS